MKKLAESAVSTSSGLNTDTLRQRHDVLADYKSVIDRIYAPGSLLPGRVTRAARRLNCFWLPDKKPEGKPKRHFVEAGIRRLDPTVPAPESRTSSNTLA